jgi:polysaccharide biosynthesis/export protein
VLLLVCGGVGQYPPERARPTPLAGRVRRVDQLQHLKPSSRVKGFASRLPKWLKWSSGRRLAFAQLASTGLVLSLAGCQALPGDGPLMIDVAGQSRDSAPYDLVDLDPTTVSSYKVKQTVAPLRAWGQSEAYRSEAVAPGDVLKVRIVEQYDGGLFPTLQRVGADLGAQRVTQSGVISIPFAGIVKVAGLTLLQIQHRITQQLHDKAPEAEVLVELVSDRTHRVTVSGEVKRPGQFSLLDGLRSARDAVDAAGGPASTVDTAAAQFEIVVQRADKVVFKGQYIDVLAGQNIMLNEGDDIVVRHNPQRFTALGAVLKAGNVDINKTSLTLLEALGAVGGLSDERANKTGVFIFRFSPSGPQSPGRSRIFRLNLMEPSSIFVALQFEIKPMDVIYVTNAPIYEYNKALSALYRTVSVYSVLKGATTTSTTY